MGGRASGFRKFAFAIPVAGFTTFVGFTPVDPITNLPPDA